MSQLIPGSVRRSLAAAAPPGLLHRGRRLLDGASTAQRTARRLNDQVTAVRVRRSRRRLARSGAGHLVPVAVNGRSVLAVATETFHADQVYAAQAGAVADALEAGGVDYFYLTDDPNRRRVLVVALSQRVAALSALARGLSGTAASIAPVYAHRPRLARQVGARAPRLTRTVRVFSVLATPSGAYLSGAEMGCDLQFWRQTDASTPPNSSGEPLPLGSLIGERSFEPVPEVVAAPEHSVIEREIDGRRRPALASLAHPQLLQVVEPIDVVYTWVDGNDPAWQQRKARALHGRTESSLHDLAANASRYASRDELKYSLRSVDMYAPWVRHIYLVTDDQTPPWLRREHPRLTVVSHRELFSDRGRLPTFNSHAIETQLHRIDGLAENYLYFNDDVFLGRPVPPETFVLANGLSRFFLSSVKAEVGPVRPDDLPITTAAKNNRDLLIEKFGRSTVNKFQHAPYSLRRSVMFELEHLFADEVAATAAAPFRSPTDLSLSASLGHYYGFLIGKAVPGSLRYRYADIAGPGTPEQLELLLRRRDYDAFCLNDHDSSQLSTAEQSEVLDGFLSRYFPLPSQFELPGQAEH